MIYWDFRATIPFDSRLFLCYYYCRLPGRIRVPTCNKQEKRRCMMC